MKKLLYFILYNLFEITLMIMSITISLLSVLAFKKSFLNMDLFLFLLTEYGCLVFYVYAWAELIFKE